MERERERERERKIGKVQKKIEIILDLML